MLLPLLLASLSLHVDAGLTGCPTEAELHAAFPESTKPLADGASLEVHFFETAAGPAAKVVRLRNGRPDGERKVEVPGLTCEQLTQAVGLVLELVRLEAAEAAARKPLPVDPTTVLGAQEPAPAPPTELRLAVGGAASVGQNLGPAVGAQAELQLRLPKLRLGAGAFYDSAASVSVREGSVRVQLAGGQASGTWAVWRSLDVGATVVAGAWQAAALELPSSRTALAPYVAVGPRVDWSWAFNDAFSLSARAEMWVALGTASWRVGSEVVAQTPPVGARLGLAATFDVGL